MRGKNLNFFQSMYFLEVKINADYKLTDKV